LLPEAQSLFHVEVAHAQKLRRIEEKRDHEDGAVQFQEPGEKASAKPQPCECTRKCNVHRSPLYISESLKIAVRNASYLIVLFFAMNLLFTATDGQGGGSFSAAYSGEVFLITLISAPNSFSAPRAASVFVSQRFPIGSLTYSVILCFFINLTPPFAWIGSFFRNRAACRRWNIFVIFFFQKFKQIGNEGFFEEVAFEPSIDEVVDEMVRPQKLQVLRHVRLADVEGLFEVAYALDALCEVFEDLDANRMGDDFEQIKALIKRDHG
jgi:hypothetical protein